MTPCDHLRAGQWPIRIEHTFTMLVSFADAVASCRTCGQTYLLELLDVRGSDRLYRLSICNPELTAQLLTDLNRGSCDLQRAQAQFDEFSRQSQASGTLLWTDSQRSIIREVVTTDLNLPVDGWQSLPCDGSWFERLGLT